VIDILPNATARAEWEQRLSEEYGRPVVMRGAHKEARPPDGAAPFGGIAYTAGANGSLVREPRLAVLPSPKCCSTYHKIEYHVARAHFM
jgi:hypothetical protein